VTNRPVSSVIPWNAAAPWLFVTMTATFGARLAANATAADNIHRISEIQRAARFTVATGIGPD
jgi:hypothetical protein